MKYIGTIIWTLISVIFSIALLEHFNSDFEVVTTSILVIIWATVEHGFSVGALNSVRTTLFMYKKSLDSKLSPNDDFSDIETGEDVIKHLKNNIRDEYVNKEKIMDELKEAEENLKKAEVKSYITAGGNFIIWIWAIIKILGVI